MSSLIREVEGYGPAGKLAAARVVDAINAANRAVLSNDHAKAAYDAGHRDQFHGFIEDRRRHAAAAMNEWRRAIKAANKNQSLEAAIHRAVTPAIPRRSVHRWE